ncbi:MAG: cytochrome c family protein [Firmicutes bacterium]|nr:cytochrome c family protein [Bacillota bacterium]
MHPFDRAFRLVLPLGAVAVLGTVLAVGWLTEPDRFAKGYAPQQPIPFSHQLHAGTLKMDCQYCHAGASKSRTAGVPSVETCMGCHKVTKTDRPAIQQLTKLYESGQTLAWERVHTLPDHVFFDHRPHVNAGVACQTCHGEVQTMTVLRRDMGMRMSNCLACHRDPSHALPKDTKIKRAAEHCAACHR